jgi:glyoxylase-like metal-dependent hydrolase (beta-lactamase superfamily II)
VEPAGKQVPSYYRSKLGDFELTVVSDGARPIPLPPRFVVNVPNGEVLKAAEAAYMPKGTVFAPFNPVVVNTGSKLVLIDTGYGSGLGPTVGLLPQSLAAAGIDPKSIDIVLISHLHGDHINGLKKPDGSLAFPNAEIKVPAVDWAFWMSDENMAKAPEGFFKSSSLQPKDLRRHQDQGDDLSVGR